MPPHLFNLIPEHLTSYEFFLEIYSVFHDESGLGKSDPRLSSMASHTYYRNTKQLDIEMTYQKQK